jgi:hypothetical protein
LTASIVLDLSTPPTAEHSDRHVISAAALHDAPPGMRIIVLVGARKWDLDPAAVHLLHAQSDRLSLDIRGNDSTTVYRWYSAVRAGDLGLVA